MSRQTSLRGGKAKGVPGAAQKLGSEWLGWRGVVAHPDAPAGGGGHGHFLLRRVAQRKPATRPSAGRPRPIAPVPLQGTPAPRPPNQSPVTNPHSLGVLKSVQTDLVDVKVDAKVVADGAAASGAGETSFTQPGWTSPGYSTDPHHKIVKFNGKFTWKGTITVQTVYAAQARPDQLSGYGRGTTDADVRSRDITLGFHESCHRRDYEAYLKAHPLPEPPIWQLA